MQVFFSTPTDILGFMQTFKQNVYRHRIPLESIAKSSENLIQISFIKDKSLLESKIFKEFVVPIHEFLTTAHKFYNLIQSLISKINDYPFELESIMEKARNPPIPTPIPHKTRFHQSVSPLKSPVSTEKRSATPDSLLWRFEKSELSWKTPKKDGIIKDIIEKSFEKKFNKGHCFLYEEMDGELDYSWKELLNLRGEITKLLWEEERRVRKTKQIEEKIGEKEHIEYNWAKVINNKENILYK